MVAQAVAEAITYPAVGAALDIERVSHCVLQKTMEGGVMT
jgi:hypothetical protein